MEIFDPLYSFSNCKRFWQQIVTPLLRLIAFEFLYTTKKKYWKYVVKFIFYSGFVSYALDLFHMKCRYMVSEACLVKCVLSAARVVKVIQFVFTAS